MVNIQLFNLLHFNASHLKISSHQLKLWAPCSRSNLCCYSCILKFLHHVKFKIIRYKYPILTELKWSKICKKWLRNLWSRVNRCLMLNGWPGGFRFSINHCFFYEIYKLLFSNKGTHTDKQYFWITQQYHYIYQMYYTCNTFSTSPSKIWNSIIYKTFYAVH